MAEMKKVVITVLGYDRKGIIARVTDALYRYDANILDISQTILSGLFNMILIADVSSPACDLDALTEELRTFGREHNLQIRVQRSEIFEAMHQV